MNSETEQIETTVNIKEVLNWRYTTKAFDTSKKISAENVENIKALLQLSPSSIN